MSENLVLLVDDEPNVLRGLTRELYEADVCTVQTAANAEEGLSAIYNNPTIQTVISDFHMPGMKGIAFLAEVEKFNPDITRIILTGAAELAIAIEAVNRGHIFRFLLKPCPSDIFVGSVKAGIRQYRLVNSEKELLQKTLSGSIKIMVDILAALDPISFAQANRLRDMARPFAIALQMDQIWEVELAALLSQIGTVTVPREVLEKRNRGDELLGYEKGMLRSIPRIGAQLVQNIPRLENIAKAILYQNAPYKSYTGTLNDIAGNHIPQTARLLKIIIDYDQFLMEALNPEAALSEMLKNREDYDLRMFEVFRQIIVEVGSLRDFSGEKDNTNVEFVLIDDVRPGMALAKDVFDKRGRLVVTKGTIITEVLRLRLANFFWTQGMIEPVAIRKDSIN